MDLIVVHRTMPVRHVRFPQFSEPMKRWFDRSFEFNLPAWQFPNLVARLCGTPARLDELVRSLPKDRLTARPGGQWSIQENVGHLLDLEPLWLGRVEDVLSGKARLRDADLTNRKTDEAHHNDRPIGDLLDEVRAARTRLVTRVEALDEASIQRAAIHPRLEQPMRILDLVYFVVEHDDHHIATVRRLLVDEAGGAG